MSQPQLILASASIGRKTLLEKLGVPFKVWPSQIDEDAIIDANPIKMLELRARAKAENAKNHFIANTTVKNYLIVAADSMAIHNHKTYGKAKNKTSAREIVIALMGKTHAFVTATAIISIQNDRESERFEAVTKTLVTLRKLKDLEIAAYVNRYDFTRFAAGYALNETPWDMVTKIDGSYTNVIGLPFEILLPLLRNFKIL